MSIRIHLDTDVGGDIDDLCAMAMLLEWNDLEITGVTTTADDGGRRAGYARYVLGEMRDTSHIYERCQGAT